MWRLCQDDCYNNRQQGDDYYDDDDDNQTCRKRGLRDILEGGYADDIKYEASTTPRLITTGTKRMLYTSTPRSGTRSPVMHRGRSRGIRLSLRPALSHKNFFRSKFLDRPRCSDCGCQHPTECYMLCSSCDFCHIGGEQECYHQHPELRGTRPAKDKYRRPASSSSQPDLEALSDLDPESDSKTIKGVNDDTVKIDSTDNTVSTVSSVSNGTKSSVDTKGSVEDLTTSLGTLTVIEKTVDKIEFAREQTPEVFVFNSPQTTPVAKKTVETKGKAPEPISKVELPIRTKEDEKSTETQDKAQLAASKEDNKPNEKVTDDVS